MNNTAFGANTANFLQVLSEREMFLARLKFQFARPGPRKVLRPRLPPPDMELDSGSPPDVSGAKTVPERWMRFWRRSTAARL